jgi:arylsulfatase A-like enzyme
MVGFFSGDADRIHDPKATIAYELAGSAAVFRGDYKMMRNNPPFGDKKWRLYRYTDDPLELDDRTEAEPKRFAEMQAAYDAYAKEVNLIEVPDDYNPVVQIQKNVDRNQGKELTKKVPVLD